MPYNVEPHIALEILEAMLREANVTVVYGAEVKAVAKNGTRLTTLTMMDGRLSSHCMLRCCCCCCCCYCCYFVVVVVVVVLLL